MKALWTSPAVAVLGALFFWHATDGLEAFTAEGARRLSVAHSRPAVPSVPLQTMSGQIENVRSNSNKVVIAEFIYTSCPTICQTGGSKFARLRNELIAKGLADRVRILSISFDPQTDQLAELKSYGNRHKADGKVWTIARPEITDVPTLLNAFGVVVIPDEFGGYEHNAAMHIVNQDGRLVAIIDSDDVAGALRETARTLQ